MPLLTKSKYLIGLKCPKLLWITFNAKDRLPGVDEATQHRFDQGHVIGALAKSWFPDGIDVPEDDFKANIEQTKEALKSGKPVFEAGIMVNNIYSRADILNPVGDQYDIIEVKSSTKIKDVYIEDVAFQRFVYQKAGLRIRKCFVMNINNNYVRSGEIDPKQLLKLEDVTAEVEAVKGIEERIEEMFKVIASGECPDVNIGPFCNDPYPCDMEFDCWKNVPDDNVFTLYYVGKNGWELFNKGVMSIKDIPADFKLNENQRIQVECAKSGEPHINKAEIAKFLNTFEFPLYYLDFETHNTALPLYDGTRPYQQVPFQFSLHVQQEDGSTEHHEFLHDDSTDPRPAFLEKLKSVLSDSGSIVVFNQSFEIGRLRECSEAFPDYQEWFNNLLPRFIDLITPFKRFDYHSPEQHGSNSIKAVLPAITKQSYEDLEIAEGEQASLAYLSLINDDLSADERARIRKDLLKYCERDTEAMLWVVEALRKLKS